LVLSNVSIDFQTNLLALFEDLGGNKYVTNNVLMNVSAALIHFKLFFFSIIFKGKLLFTPLDYMCIPWWFGIYRVYVFNMWFGMVQHQKVFRCREGRKIGSTISILQSWGR